MRFLHEVAIAPVDYRHHASAACPEEVNSPVRVGSGARLADGHHERAGHVVRQPGAGRRPSRQFRSGHGRYVYLRERPGDGGSDGLAGYGRRALADYQDATNAAGRKGLPQPLRNDVIAQTGDQTAIFSGNEFPAAGSCEPKAVIQISLSKGNA